MAEVEVHDALSRKLDRVIELLEDSFLTPEELREVLHVKLLYREGKLLEETVDINELLGEIE
ncbi:MAG: hypothetical protein GXN93_05315 [Candidatus Diapherotrites archaeon]|nr:hypothetical protein [Candidatus Diapherotrites archaeon]